MEEYKRNLEIINSILEDTGIVRYNAIKNRFKNESMDSPTLLYFYKSIIPVEEENTSAIGAYRENLQKLRRKIEERRIRVIEREIDGVETKEVQEETVVRNQELIVDVGQEEGRMTVVGSTPVVKNVRIGFLSTLEDLKYATVSGSAIAKKGKNKLAAEISLEGNIFTSEITEKKKKTKTIIRTDVTLAKVYLIFKEQKRILSYLSRPPQKVCIEKETEIINLNKIKGNLTEVILKNANTGVFTKYITRSLGFSVKEAHKNPIDYEIGTEDEFVRWALLLKTRMYTVDRWSKDELLELIRR